MAKTSNVNASELFNNYQKADDSVQAARLALDNAMAQRTLTVQAIVSAMGKGPFQYGGKSIQAVSRSQKNDEGQVTGTTWFFKSIGTEVIVID
jgi:hypothetical protein